MSTHARWKAAAGPNRKWPHRRYQQLESNVLALLQNVDEYGRFPPEKEERLMELLGKINSELSSVYIHL